MSIQPELAAKQRFVAFLIDLSTIGDKPDDSEDQRLKHKFLVFMGITMSLGGVLWGSISVWYKLFLPASFPYGYTIITMLNLMYFSRTKNFPLVRFIQVMISLLLPFLFQLSLGGFIPSGGVILWSMLALIGSFSFTESRYAYWVLVGFIVLTMISGLFDGYVQQYSIEVDQNISILFFVMNICVISTCVFWLTYYFVRQTEVTKAALEQNLALRELNKIKSDFLSTVSHELRTPLTSILGFTGMIRKKLEKSVIPNIQIADPKTDKAITQIRGNLDIIITEGNRLTNLINDVLDLTKLESGKIEWKMEQVFIDEIITHSTKSTESLFKANDNLELVLKIDDNLAPIIGDRDRLIQVIINLISNAVKFTPKGRITVSATTKMDRNSEDNCIQICVSDTGIGISSNDLEVIFDKFKQVGDTLTEKPRGSGLGLPISDQIVKHHGGRISVESEPNKGSRFTITLPVTISEKGTDETFNTAKALPEQTKVEIVRSAKKILVVDDDSSIRQMIDQDLSEAGYLVIQSSNGQDALEKISGDKPDLIILDVMMPDKTGLEVVRELKAMSELATIPIMMISAGDNRQKGTEAGIDGYFAKPLDMEKLHQDVDTMLLKNATEETAQRRGHDQSIVMIVDDDSGIREYLRQELEDMGYAVLECADGLSALEQVKATNPNLIILDILMPGVNGFDVATLLKQNPATSEIPIIMVSVIGDENRRRKLGIEGYFKKPIDINRLHDEVVKLIGQPKNSIS